MWNTLGKIIGNMLTILGYVLYKAIRTSPRWAPTAANWTIGGLGFFLALCFLFIVAGIAFGYTIPLYIGLSLLMLFFIVLYGATKAATGNRTGFPVDLYETFRDITIMLGMLSIIVLLGHEMGISLPAKLWFAIASLVAIILMLGLPTSYRQRIMTGIALVLVAFSVIYSLSPQTRNVVKSLTAQGQVSQYKAADALRPNTPEAALEIHQRTSSQILANELARYQSRANYYSNLSGMRPLTDAEINDYHAAMAQVENLSRSLKVRESSDPTWAHSVWTVVYVLVGLLVLAAISWLLYRYIQTIPMVGHHPTPATTNAPAHATPATTHHAHAAHPRNWTPVIVAAITLAVLGGLYMIALGPVAPNDDVLTLIIFGGLATVMVIGLCYLLFTKTNTHSHGGH